MTRGGARIGAGRKPAAGLAQTERINLSLTEAELAEISAAVPAGKTVGRWVIEQALGSARRSR